MQQSCNSIDKIKELRDRTGSPLPACANAYKRAEGDVLIAEGILKYDGCAINIKQGTYDDWVMRNARGYKTRVLMDPSQRTPHHINSLQNQ